MSFLKINGVKIGKSVTACSQWGSFRGRALWLIVVMVVVIRLFLTSDRDVFALNAPYDEYWYVHNAARMIWGGDYNQLAFAHLPIYSMWLTLLNVLGVPARLGIDLAWLAATAYAGYALFRFTGRRSVGGLFWAYCAFHPLFFVLFDRALSETLLSVLVVLLVGSGLEIWNTRLDPSSLRGRWASHAFCVALALAFHVRKEGGMLFAPLALLALYSWARRKEWWHPPVGLTLPGRLLVFPLLLVVAAGCALAAINYLRWGVAVRYELAAPGYEKAMSALNRIDAGRGPLHVTVTSKARQLAYQNSPTFSELQFFFEGEQGKSLAAHTAQYTGQQGEIGNGWFYWALRDAGAAAGWHSSARHADQKYAAISEELEDAFRAGRLKSYSSLFPSFLDPDVGKWIARVPSSTLATLALVIEALPQSVAVGAEDATPKQFVEFVEVVGRRNPLPSVAVRGWIIAPEGATVGLAQVGKAVTNWVVLRGPARPDVSGALPFRLASTGTELPDELLVKSRDGKIGKIAIDVLHEGAMGVTEGEVNAKLGVDELSGGVRSTRIERWLSYLAKKPLKFDWIGALGRFYVFLNVTLASLVLVLTLKVFVKRRWHSPLTALLLIVCTTILSRAILFGVLDASSWSGVQARYMAPMVPIFAFLGVVAAWDLVRSKGIPEMADESYSN